MSAETISSTHLAGTSCKNTTNSDNKPENMTKPLMRASHANLQDSVAVAHLLQAPMGFKTSTTDL